MESNIDIITFPSNYINRILRELNNIDEVMKELFKFSDFHNKELDHVIYFFVKETIQQNIFFKFNEEIREELLFESIYWASLNETRRKCRPKNYKEVQENKTNTFFTSLLKEMIKCIYEEHDSSSPSFDIILNRYLTFFFDLSCIKRKRK